MTTSRGFTLLTAVILASVVLALGIALLDIAYKQIVLASTAKNSQYAFYAADTGLECALYYDQQQAQFDYSGLASNSISCNNGQSISLITAPNSSTQDTVAGVRTTAFDIPCTTGGSSVLAHVTVTKASNGATVIYSTGYSSCNTSDTRRIERGLKVTY